MNSEKNYTHNGEVAKQASKNFFFDTYALYEVIRGNKGYDKYLSVGIVTTKLNLFELYHGFLKEGNLDLANTSLEKYYEFTQDFDKNVIKNAAELKKKLNKRDISMADCIGYCFAQRLEIKFLTGDKEFEQLENVEFVK